VVHLKLEFKKSYDLMSYDFFNKIKDCHTRVKNILG